MIFIFNGGLLFQLQRVFFCSLLLFAIGRQESYFLQFAFIERGPIYFFSCHSPFHSLNAQVQVIFTFGM